MPVAAPRIPPNSTPRNRVHRYAGIEKLRAATTVSGIISTNGRRPFSSAKTLVRNHSISSGMVIPATTSMAAACSATSVISSASTGLAHSRPCPG